MSDRPLIAALLTALVVLAGCSGASAPAADGTSDPGSAGATTSARQSSQNSTSTAAGPDPAATSTPTRSDSAGDPPGTPVEELPGDASEYPDPPGELTDANAKAVAYAAEEAYVSARLSNAAGVDASGLGGPASAERTVLNRSDGGVYVRVAVPYYYESGDYHADLASDAVYFVGPDAVRRVGGPGVNLSVRPAAETGPPSKTPAGTPASRLPDGPRSYGLAEPSESVTEAMAKLVADSVESTAVYNALADASGVDDFGIRDGVDRTVLNHSDGGFYVRVRVPYYYRTDGTRRNATSEAVYFVAVDTTVRVGGSDLGSLANASASGPAVDSG